MLLILKEYKEVAVMAKYVKVASREDLAGGTKKEVVANGNKILLVRIGENFYACQADCPHWGWPLVRGKLEGNVLQCSFHRSRFDVTNGKIVRWTIGNDGPAKAFPYGFLNMLKSWKPHKLKTYKVKVEDNDVLVQI